MDLGGEPFSESDLDGGPLFRIFSDAESFSDADDWVSELDVSTRRKYSSSTSDTFVEGSRSMVVDDVFCRDHILRTEPNVPARRGSFSASVREI